MKILLTAAILISIQSQAMVGDFLTNPDTLADQLDRGKVIGLVGLSSLVGGLAAGDLVPAGVGLLLMDGSIDLSAPEAQTELVQEAYSADGASSPVMSIMAERLNVSRDQVKQAVKELSAQSGGAITLSENEIQMKIQENQKP